ncbi:ISMca7, transposase [Candidatus Rhodobacter oscarellae]|uniref:ISMca7, transposase n=1 Tax=Candidatus Rhodobacter oscarellae TaxID=1675527 RepID=A0A0J9E3B6_9RHOB|nr:ISMca7, transposase [Candidatus Rhodobacter lobularis]
MKLEAQLARDLLFRKFCRLELDQGVPQASTLGRFRARLRDRLEAVVAEVVAQLEAARVVLAEGRVAIVDATVVEAARSGLRKRDPGAGSAVKVTVKGRKQAVWGWQAFVNCDEDGYIRRVAVSAGNRAEVDSLEALVAGDESALYADAAYIGPRTRALLARRGMADRVQRRGARGHPLSDENKARNVEIGVTRGRVEAIFGHWKRHWGLRRTRFLGEAKMMTVTTLAAIGWNLHKGARFRRLYG